MNKQRNNFLSELLLMEMRLTKVVIKLLSATFRNIGGQSKSASAGKAVKKGRHPK